MRHLRNQWITLLRICYYGINVKITAIQVYHRCKIFVIPESTGSSLDVLYDAVDPFKYGICKTVFKVVEYLLPMVTYQAAQFLHRL